MLVAQAALDTGAFDRVLEIERRAPDHLISAELLCSAGIACWRLERRDEAITRLNRELATRSDHAAS